jgi:4-hydroxy-3-polyprenylbenzoate decarboxylase
VSKPKRIIVGISGASGVVYGIRALQLLKKAGVETHLVVSKAAEMTMAYECDYTIKDLRAMADHHHAQVDIGASISSGSFHTLGMLIAPCSIRTMSEIATGVTSSLLTRAADVTLKERRPLVLMVRETPFHLGHLRTMTALTEMGAIIAPPLPAFALQKAISTTIRDFSRDYWTGTIYTTNRRVWEHDDTFKKYLKKIHVLAVDMETATIFMTGFFNQIPTGALLLVSDQPMFPEGVKTAESDKEVDATYVNDHLKIGIAALKQLINKGLTVKHLRF